MSHLIGWFCLFMECSATFNYISVISLRLVLLVEEPEYPEKTTDLSQITDKLIHNVVHLAMNVVRAHNFSRDRH
jgi:hypothetical protein